MLMFKVQNFGGHAAHFARRTAIFGRILSDIIYNVVAQYMQGMPQDHISVGIIMFSTIHYMSNSAVGPLFVRFVCLSPVWTLVVM